MFVAERGRKYGHWPGMVQMRTGIPSWKCSKCNFVFKGEKAPERCPLCHRKSKFEIVRDYRDFSDIEMD